MISLAQQFNLLIAIFAIIPTWKLWSYYLRTKNLDFLIFGGVFCSASLGLLGAILGSTYDLLFIYQFQYIFLNATFFLLFWYSFRVLATMPKSLLIFGFTWFALLISSIIFWKIIDHPETTKLLFWEVPHSYSAYFPNGAGFKYNENIIYSTGFRLFGDTFRIFAFIFNLYAFVSVKPVVAKDELNLAKKLWITATLCFLVYAIMILPWMNFIPIIPNLLNLIGLIIVTYITIKIPEGLIISHAQMLRVLDLYDLVDKYSEKSQTQKYEDLIQYMIGIKP